MIHRCAIALALLAACTKAETDGTQLFGDPVLPSVVAPVVRGTPSPLLLELVGSQSVNDDTDTDATALGAAVDVYLVERAGLAHDGIQSFDMLLVVASPAGHLVLGGLDHEESVGGSPRPFGSLVAVPPASAPLLFDHTTRDINGDEKHVRITHDGDALGVQLSQTLAGSTPTNEITIGTTHLAGGTRVTTPTIAVATPTYEGTVEVRERIYYSDPRGTLVTFDLRIGSVRAPFGVCYEDKPLFRGERVWTATSLREPPPITGTLVAARECASESREMYALERRDRRFVVWHRESETPWTSNDLPLN